MLSLRAFLADAARFLATAVAADYLAEARARAFDAHVDAALELAAPTPIADAVASDLGDLWAVETVEDVRYLWGERA
jgi:hypothetical protein